MNNFIAEVIEAVAAWEDIYRETDQGIRFFLDDDIVGMIDSDGLIYIPLTSLICERLSHSDNILKHYEITENGEIQLHIRDYVDTQHAIWLLRLSYIHKMIRQSRRNKDRMSQLRRQMRKEDQDIFAFIN
jgi:hypothetical protein